MRPATRRSTQLFWPAKRPPSNSFWNAVVALAPSAIVGRLLYTTPFSTDTMTSCASSLNLVPPTFASPPTPLGSSPFTPYALLFPSIHDISSRTYHFASFGWNLSPFKPRNRKDG